MRVPVHPDDLARATGFKRIAKRLQKKWPGTPPISLSLSRELLSKGFGYNGYYDVLNSSKTCLPNTPPLSDAQVRAGIVKALLAAQATHGLSVDPIELQVVVDELPLHALVVLNPLNDALPPTVSTQHAVSRLHFAKSADPEHEDPRDLAPAVTVKTRPKRLESPKQQITQAQLRDIEEVVRRSGNLRDQCLFSLLQSGSRVHEFLSMKATPAYQSGGGVWMINDAAPRLAFSDAGVLQRYIQAYKLPPDGYLFPCAHDSTRPITSEAFMKIFTGWLAKSGLKKMSPHSVRASVITQLMTTLRPDSIRLTAGHKRSTYTQLYVRPAIRDEDR